MSKWTNTETNDIFDTYEEACDDIYDCLTPDDVLDYIFETCEQSEIIQALNGDKPDFYTDKFCELADKYCGEQIEEIYYDDDDENEVY